MKELCKDKPLNNLIIHDDVPFFWDNWDILHHSYETLRVNLNTLKNPDLTHKINTQDG